MSDVDDTTNPQEDIRFKWLAARVHTSYAFLEADDFAKRFFSDPNVEAVQSWLRSGDKYALIFSGDTPTASTSLPRRMGGAKLEDAREKLRGEVGS